MGACHPRKWRYGRLNFPKTLKSHPFATNFGS